jgi:RHS repeat-associated protein
MSVRARTGRRRLVSRLISHLLLVTFGIQNGAVAQAPLTRPQSAAVYRVSTPFHDVVPSEDPAAPTLTVSAVRTLLWPPNHEMWDVGLVVTAADGTGSTMALFGRAYSDEPPNGTGDGDKEPDALLDAPNLLLRAERQGTADGRVYLALVTATGDAGSTTACVSVVVPKANTAASIAAVRAQAEAAEAVCDGTGSPPAGFFLIGEGSLAPTNHAPTVDAGPDRAVSFPADAVPLDGSVVDDGFPSGTVSVAWSAVGGPGTVVFADPGAPVTTASFETPGTYTLALTAADGQLAATDHVTVTVGSANQPPVVSAGADRVITLPETAVSLEGTVEDDGLPPGGGLGVLWSVVSGPGPVTFSSPTQPSTDATLEVAGTYLLRLTATDSQATASDDVEVTLSAAPLPALSIADVSVVEGQGDGVNAVLSVTLSAPSTDPVGFAYGTGEGTASMECDYRRRFRAAGFAPGTTTQYVAVPIVGDLSPEDAETFRVQIGEVTGAVIADPDAEVTIVDDDVPNEPPAAPASLTPVDGATGTGLDPILSWAASDPDGDTVTHDVYFGTSFDTTGQGWTRLCAAGQGPGPRASAATAYDEEADRLIVFGGADAGGADLADAWVLANATGTGGVPAWSPLSVDGGPAGRRQATAAYDPQTNRLIVHGGCQGGCDTVLPDTWVLTSANGVGGLPQWIPLPDAPVGRTGHVAALDPGSGRMIVFGGSAGQGGPDLNDVWVLKDANGVGTPAWEPLAPAGVPPQPRSGAAGAYDPASNLLVIFGGRSSDDVPFGDAFVLSHANGLGGTPEWSPLPAGDSPPAPRWGHVAAHDGASRRLLIFGGTGPGYETGQNFVANDVWLMDEGGGTAEWIPLAVGGAPPAGRLLSSAAYSPSRNRMVVTLGTNNRTTPTHFDDLWVLTNAIGSLPLVSENQSETAYATDAGSASTTYYWRIVSRDGHGATAASAVQRFRPNRAPVVGAGPDLSTALPAAAVTLNGTVTDDGLPETGTLSAEWSEIAGPGTVTFADPSAATTTATFAAAGTYVLRLAASDGDLWASDEVTVNVEAANTPPLVDAGPDQTITLPEDQVAIAGTVTDDGLPTGGTLALSWTALAGPGPVTFGDASAASTNAQFVADGTYVLRLTASDSQLAAYDDVTVVVVPANQPPVVNAGPDQAILPPADTVTLQGLVADDGQPAGTLLSAWSVVTGPAQVSFGDAASAVTTATFAAPGVYELRLSASDTELTGTDEVTVVVASSALPPDLVVASVDATALEVDPRTLEMAGTVAAVIGNVGTGPAAGPLSVVFFEDRDANGAFDPQADLVLGSASHIGLDAGGSGSVAATLFATVLFKGNLIYAFVDSGGDVVESDETNNYGSSAAACVFTPPVEGWDPALEWTWTGSSVLPASMKVTMAPVVIDLTADGVPEVLFTTWEGNDEQADGHLRAVRGSDGAPVFTVTDPVYDLYPPGQLAVGDIDLDGRPEIVGVDESRTHLIAFEHDGTFKWRSPTIENAQWGGAALADLEGDGVPEIVIGRQVLDNTGALRWTGTAGRGADTRGTLLSVVADLDMDGVPEVVAGNTAYRASGALYWTNAALPDGHNAIGNFDADPFPEVVLVNTGKVWLLEHTGPVKWGPVDIPQGGIGGAPTVADFDADGQPEIGVVGQLRYAVFETDGSLKWAAPIQDGTSSTGSTVFDFEGDGAAEVIYADEVNLRIYRGADGAIQFQTPIGSRTAQEHTVIADVDGDGNAELVGTSDGFTSSARHGIYVFGDASDGWVVTRKIWNQHTYHITNVNEDGTVPAHEPNGWQVFGSYRQNTLTRTTPQGPGPACVYAKPDLTASYLRVTMAEDARALVVRIGNGGDAITGPDVPVSFYDGDPAFGAPRLGTVRTTRYLGPGEFEDVALTLPAAVTTVSSVWVAADDAGDLHGIVTESDEANNVFDSGRALLAGDGQPDLVITAVDVSGVSGDAQTLAVTGAVLAEIRNQGDGPAAGPFAVSFFEDRNGDGAFQGGVDLLLGSASHPALEAGASAMVSAPLGGVMLFRNNAIHGYVDSGGAVAEANEANNVARSGRTCAFHPPAGSFSPREEWAWTASPTSPAHTNVLAMPAVADLDGDSLAEVVFPTFSTNANLDGRLRAVRGGSGQELFTVSDPAGRVAGSAQIAIGDLDAGDPSGDAQPEIVAVQEGGFRLVAFEHTGALKWVSATLDSSGSSAPYLADLDGDGHAEIVVGRQVLNRDGTVRATGAGSSKAVNGLTGSFSIAADLDGDGKSELIVGNTAYQFTPAGLAILWQKTALPDGYNAVGNFDSDDLPEVVLVSQGSVWLLENDGTIKWGPVTVPGAGFSGGPVVADFDGDARPEIVVGTRSKLSLVETGGFVRWTVDTDQVQSPTSIGVGASAFDFDGDGAAELVYADESGLWVRRGKDGLPLVQQPLDTCVQGRGYPVVADVDGDGNAEIVTGSNQVCAGSQTRGLHVLGERTDRWVTARRIWNQHGYSVTNVDDEGAIPAAPQPSWLASNSFRANSFGPGSRFAAPDLTASYVRRTDVGTDLRFTVRVGNAGMAAVPAGLPISFYNGDPRPGFPLLATLATSQPLAPGQFEDVDFTVASSTTAESELFVVADDAGDGPGTVSECDEENNFHASGFFLNRPPDVHAGPDQVIAFPTDTVAVSGSASDDGLPLEVPLATSWQYFGGPLDPTEHPQLFADPSALATTATFPMPGVYTLGLVADDSALIATDKLVVTVYAANQAPQVNAGPDKTIGLPADTVALSGTVSDDGLPAGGTLTTTWTKVEGPGLVTFVDPSSAATTAQFGAAGTYVLRLTANDGALSSGDDVTVKVNAVNQPPVVSAGPDQVVGTPVASLVGSVADDGLPQGGSVTQAWTLVSGPGAATFADAAAAATTVTFNADGDYVLRLTGSDGALAAYDDVLVRVNPVNQAPVVDAGADQSITTIGTTLAGTVADDGLPAGGALTVAWSVASGPGTVTFGNAGSPTTTASFAVDGEYELLLTASDSVFTNSDPVTVTVNAGNRPPVVSAGADQVLALPDNDAALEGAVSDDGLPGGSVTAAWSQVEGPGAATFADPSSPASGVSFDAPGAYVLRLTASDGVLAAADDVVVTVQAGAPQGPPPAVSIASPTERQGIGAPADLVGTVASQSLLGWNLEHRRAGAAIWTRFASGEAPAQNAVLGTLDPTLLLNGLYEVRLKATDSAGRVAATSVHVVVKDNQKVGHFALSFVDLEVPLSGLPIRVTRTYDNRDKGKGDFGRGWRMDLSNARVEENGTAGLSWLGTNSGGFFSTYCLQAVKPQVVTVTFPDGKVHEFETLVSPQCQPFIPIDQVTVSFKALPGTLGTLAPVGGSVAYVTGAWPAPLQSAPMELFGAADFKIYDPSRYQYTSVDGRVFVIDQVQGLVSVTDANGNQLTVTPNGIVHSSGRGIAFSRDGQGRISTITDPDGQAISYGYDADGNLAAHTDRDGNTSTFSYDGAFGLAEIVDPRGVQPIRNEYYEDGRIKSHTDAFGKTIQYSHDVAGRQEIMTDREGAVRILEYDQRGNVVRETDPAGKITERTFDTRNNRLTETDPLGHTTGYTYDTKDNLLTVTDPEGNTTAYTYNARGQVLTTKDPRGLLTTNVYDAKGNLTSTTDPAGGVTTFTYDARGNVLTQKDALNHATTYVYDAFGNLAQETDALGHATTYTYDARGNRKSQTTTRTTASGTETLVTTYSYDNSGRLIRTDDPDGTFTRTVYDALGKPADTYDKLNRRTSYTYDEMGRLVRTTFPDDTDEESTYDGEGRRLTSTDRAGRITSYTYDALGRLAATTLPDGALTTNTYDDAGRLIASKDARGNTTSYEYDKAGRRTKVTDALGKSTVFTYDANGNQTAVKDAKGQTTTYDYDALNRRIKMIFPDGTFSSTAYDALGRRTGETDQAGTTTQFGYDALGRLKTVTDALGQVTAYAYDELGNRKSQTDANGHTSSFEFDGLGRETARVLPGGASESKTYDPAGNLATRTDFMGRTTAYGYDMNNRLLSRSYPDGSAVSFTYGPTGRRLTATDYRGTTTYAYDNRDRIQALTYPDGRRLEYEHDAQGNRTKLTAVLTAASLAANYSFDPLNRLATVTDALNRPYVHGYDADGNRASLAYPNGVQTAYTYDSLNRLSLLSTTHPASGVTIQSYAFTLGAAGNRTQITEGDGHVRSYTYDSLYRLIGDKVILASLPQYEKTFSYDRVGNRLTQTTTGQGAGTIGYAYDERDRLLTENAAIHGYDANGNLVTKSGEATYTWDFENRLIKIAKADGTVVEHQYDPDGNRVQTKVTPSTGPPVTTNYLVDTSGSLSHVVAETDESGALKAYYLRGDDLLAVLRPDSASSYLTHFYHADGLGSIRRLTDEAGTITDGYTYSTFGELISHTGSDPQPYAFTGEPLDPNSGFQYHRARWMDPGVGRFVGMDTFGGREEDPSSLHKYLYVSANPINFVDPTGHEGEGGVAGTLAAIGGWLTIAALNLPRFTAMIFSAAQFLAPAEFGVVPQQSGFFALRGAVAASGPIVVKELGALRRLWVAAKGGTGPIGREFEEWFFKWVLRGEGRRQVAVRAGEELGKGPGSGSRLGAAILDFVVDMKGFIVETKIGFSTVKYNQTVQAAWYAARSEQKLIFQFFKKPNAEQLAILREWIEEGGKQAGRPVEFEVTSIF